MSKEHGTTRSYIVGFALSLVFTFIPYYLVVGQGVTGAVLLVTILGFAVLQMIIQVVFFLHLGREGKPHWQLGFLVSTVGMIVVVVGASLWIMHHLHANMSAINVTDKVSEDEAVHQIHGAQTGTCPGGTGANHEIVLKSGAASPRHVDAKLCDTITIVNEDGAMREIAFGSHARMETYAGETGKDVRPGRSMVLTLTELGTHQFHDHLGDEVSGDFTVTP